MRFYPHRPISVSFSNAQGHYVVSTPRFSEFVSFAYLFGTRMGFSEYSLGGCQFSVQMVLSLTYNVDDQTIRDGTSGSVLRRRIFVRVGKPVLLVTSLFHLMSRMHLKSFSFSTVWSRVAGSGSCKAVCLGRTSYGLQYY